jgi:hypothetical protein
MINKENIEEYLFRAVENDLSSDEQQMLEQFLSKHPEYRAELEAYRRSVLVPPVVTFSNKESLYRKEDDRHILIMPLIWRAAAILIVLLFAFAVYYYFTPAKPQIANEIVLAKPEHNAGPVQNQAINTIPDQVEPSRNPTLKPRPVHSFTKHKTHETKNINPFTEKNISTPVTNLTDTSLQLQTAQNNIQQTLPDNKFSDVEYVVQPETQHQPQLQQQIMPRKKVNKNVEWVSRILRKTGNNGLANGVEYVAQLKDKEIEISYNSRYINFQKSFSLSKL